MGRKQKIIPHIPGTMDEIVESFFVNDKYLRKKKPKEEPVKRNEKKSMEKKRNEEDCNT